VEQVAKKKRPYHHSREERLAAYVRKEAPPKGVKGACWLWTRRKDRDGYGRIWDNGTDRQAHIVSYEHFIGPVPEGHDIGQTCRRHDCCNPEHLIAMTRLEGVHRGNAPTAIVQRTGVCRAGHPINDENVIVSKDGTRTCRLCRRARQREYLQRKKQQATATNGAK
jgi:hypothetical protein